jgi:uncharacterized protein YlaI
MKECPMCGEAMRLVTRDSLDRVPGTGQTTNRQVREWICPECEHWEEAETTDE